MNLDDWQIQVLKTEGNRCICSGRQCGKSTVIAKDAADRAVMNEGQNILVIAAVERQAQLLFDKILNYIYENYEQYIKKGKEKPTKHIIKLKNKSQIICVPTGMSGYGIRGYTINHLYADEAAFIPNDVWAAVTPMLAVTGGFMTLLSTPHGKMNTDGPNFFYECFNNDNFTKFYVSSEDCPRISKEFLEEKKKMMTKLQYAQEYLGKFIDELLQWFPDDLIRKCMVLKRPERLQEVPPDKYMPQMPTNKQEILYMGVDLARMGEDESTFEIIKKQIFPNNKINLIHVENIITTKSLLTDSIDLIKALIKNYKIRTTYIDDAGLGAGVFDVLLREKYNVEGINNARRMIDREETPRKKKLMKEELYTNLLKLMERGEIQLLDDPDIFLSLKSVQYEYGDKGDLKIFGNYTHITEGLIRAAWCSYDNSQIPYIEFIKSK